MQSRVVAPVVFESPAKYKLTREIAAAPSQPTLVELAQRVLAHLNRPHAGSIEGLATECGALPLHDDLRRAIDRVVALGIDAGLAWVLLAHWVLTRGGATPAADAADALRPHVGAIDPVRASDAVLIFGKLLGRHADDGWAPSRMQRLQRALGRGA